jgi:PadR family transcriptional regulator, regulatory protein PadR
VLYLKCPPSEELGVETLCRGASDTALRLLAQKHLPVCSSLSRNQQRHDNRIPFYPPANKGFVTSPCASTEVVTQCPVEVEGEALPDTRIELPQGTLDLLILKTVALGPQHGWAISERIQQISSDALCVQQGSLYPALHRLERRGWIKAKWGASENNRRAKYYELTRLGHKQLEVEKDSWSKLTAAVARVLESA